MLLVVQVVMPRVPRRTPTTNDWHGLRMVIHHLARPAQPPPLLLLLLAPALVLTEGILLLGSVSASATLSTLAGWPYTMIVTVMMFMAVIGTGLELTTASHRPSLRAWQPCSGGMAPAVAAMTITLSRRRSLEQQQQTTSRPPKAVTSITAAERMN